MSQEEIVDYAEYLLKKSHGNVYFSEDDIESVILELSLLGYINELTGSQESNKKYVLSDKGKEIYDLYYKDRFPEYEQLAL